MSGLNVIDLFCGAGGFSTGFTEAGFNIVLGIDVVERFVETFKKNHPQAQVICGDIRQISVDNIRKTIGAKKIHVIIGGPPCQGFSMAGRRDPKDPRNSLFMEFVRIVDGIKPPFFVMENVRGLLASRTASEVPVIDIIKNEFSKIGYEVEYHILLAADYGVPQKRNRLIFIGTNSGKRITFPQPTHSRIGYTDLTGKKIPAWVSVGNVLLSKDEVEKGYFHSQRMREGFIKRRQRHELKGNGFGAQYLRMDEPSYTISARYWKDGSDALVKYSEDEIRMLTPLEVARIQSFPDSYVFEGSKREVYIQIGNAVPPLLAKVIALHLKKSLPK
jgi:DNA (cytosine-5)-methyltransferase 1